MESVEGKSVAGQNSTLSTVTYNFLTCRLCLKSSKYVQMLQIRVKAVFEIIYRLITTKRLISSLIWYHLSKPKIMC